MIYESGLRSGMRLSGCALWSRRELLEEEQLCTLNKLFRILNWNERCALRRGNALRSFRYRGKLCCEWRSTAGIFPESVNSAKWLSLLLQLIIKNSDSDSNKKQNKTPIICQVLSGCQALCQALHAHDLLLLTAALQGIALLRLYFTGWRNWAQDGLKILVRKWWSRNLFRADSTSPEPSILNYSTCFLRAVSSWTRRPLMVRYPSVVSSVCSFRNCMGELHEVFFISSPWTWSRDLGGLFILTKIIRHLVTHMNTGFLIYKDSYIYKPDETLEWPGQSIDSQWESLGSPSIPEWMASTESALEASSFNKVAGCTHLSSRQEGLPIRPGHTFTCPAEKHWQILIFGLSFSMGTSILLLWHYHRLIWLISAQFISDYLFF